MVDYSDWVYLLILMFCLAGLAGFLAGLIGIGGGLVLVPGLYFVFHSLGYDSDFIMHLAVGTSLATICATSLSSARAHYKKGGVRFDWVKRIGIGLVIGVGIGTAIASNVSGLWLQIFFTLTLVILVGLLQVNPEKIKPFKNSPSIIVSYFVGGIIGFSSTLMGIGGAAFNVPYMVFNKVPIHQAIGTAATLGFFIAVPGALGFLIIGQGHGGSLPPFTIGYINLLALVVLVPVGAVFAPIGAYFSSQFSTKRLRHIFSIFMIIVAVKMILEVMRAL